MSLFLQHGSGKSTRIHDAHADGSTSGVIFSPRSEQINKLETCISDLRSLGDITLMLDPQFHISTVSSPKDGYLPDHYPYYEAGRTASDFIGAKKVRHYAEQTLDFQAAIDFDRLVSPTVILSSFSDRWAQIALQLADASVEYHASLSSAKPLLLSFVIHESALDSRQELDQFLDTLTTWDVKGFYLCIVREEATYSQSFYPDRLAHLLYASYVLGDRNGFELVFGYSDFIGLAVRAASASAFATGWSQSLRQCHQGTFLRAKTIARRPLVRYSSGPLLNTILLSELEQIANVGRLDEVLSGVALDAVITNASSPESSDWNERIAERHHWQTLGDLDSLFGGSVRNDIHGLLTRVRHARSLYIDLEASAVRFSRHCGGQHLEDWDDALTTFQRIATP